MAAAVAYADGDGGRRLLLTPFERPEISRSVD